ncbi:hypothetical protein BCUN_0245 [Bifidobacterium cuniculi]|uniref:ADP ribosyltransferase domain-containing protein n=2 Tax=Bifidobacterium cuniculi TaxID=1688 RepID=A0A087B400_9BIFI|nr:hypothetical protein BCUN_0245 [Bifidobacterium cuniculi]
MALNDLKASPGREQEFQALLDKLYKDYVDELDLMVEEAADEIETAVERGLVDRRQIVTDWTQTAAQRADDYYQAVREAWKEYAGVDMPPLDSYGLVDVNSALWETQSQLVNERYIGMRYQDAINGHTKYGVTMQDLWPSMENIDDAQQFIADMMRNSARLQTMHDMRHDPTRPRWARVPSGAKTCAFCMMLASRGFAYLSDETAGRGGSRYHADCDCKVIPSWGRQTLKGYDVERYQTWYQDGVAGAGAGAGENLILKVMRRAHPGDMTDGVFPKPDIAWSTKQIMPKQYELKRLSDPTVAKSGDKYSSAEKLKVVRGWTDGTFRSINDALFGNIPHTSEIDQRIDMMDEILRDHDTMTKFTVDRLFNIKTFNITSSSQVTDLRPGSVYGHAGYMATSLIEGGIKAVKDDGERIAARILVPPGSHAVYLQPSSKARTRQEEVLLPRDSVLQYDSYSVMSDGRIMLYLRLV